MLLLSVVRQETAVMETAAGSSAELTYLGRVRIVLAVNPTQCRINCCVGCTTGGAHAARGPDQLPIFYHAVLTSEV